MGDKTGIQWTDATWNPIIGCSIVSPACTNCYAMAQAARIQKMTPGSHYEGTTHEVNGKPVWTGVLKHAPEHILLAPLRWKKPRRIFVNSMSDLFHDAVPDEWIDEVFAVMALAPQHTFQLLTKRPKRMREYISGIPSKIPFLGRMPLERIHIEAAGHMEGDGGYMDALKRAGNVYSLYHDVRWPLPNVYLGVTAERQEEADARIPALLATPAAVRFVSAEPMLGAIDFARVGNLESIKAAMMEVAEYHERDARLNTISGMQIDALNGAQQACIFYQTPDHMGGGFTWRFPRPFPRLDWIICGGESGPGARPMHPDWARGLRDQCAAAGVPFFFKQWGEWAPVDLDAERGNRDWMIISGDGDLDIPDDRGPDEDAGECAIARVGKRRAGRLLDGVEHNEFPERR